MSEESVQGPSETIDLSEFIGEHSALFVTMGVFGALAIYISQSVTGNTLDAELMIRVGFVSSFGLSILMFALVYSKLIDELGGWHSFYHAHFYLRNTPLIAFSLLSVMLVTSISFLLTQHESVIFLLLFVAVSIFGLGMTTRILWGIGQYVPDSPVLRLTTVFLVSLAMFLTSFFLRTRVLSRYEVTPIQSLSLAEPLPVVITSLVLLTAIVQSLSALGVLSPLLGVPLMLHDKIRGKGAYEQ